MMKIKDKVIDLIRNRKTSLPTLPVVINNIIVTARSEKTSAHELAGFIMNDQAISARVLKVANSAYYGASQKIDTISRAITLLGFQGILSLVLGMGIFSAFAQKGRNGFFDMGELWKHSIGVGYAGRIIAASTGRNVNESLILIGLLHDIGKIVFAVHFPDEYARVLEEADREQAPLHRMEKEILGLDHAETAYLLMKQWNFPTNMIHPVRYHHDPCACPEQELHMAMVVNAADFVCHQSAVGPGASNDLQPDKEVRTKLDLYDDKIVTLTEALESERPHIDDFLEALS